MGYWKDLADKEEREYNADMTSEWVGFAVKLILIGGILITIWIN